MIIVVKDPKEPVYGENGFVLEEELSIGEAVGVSSGQSKKEKS